MAVTPADFPATFAAPISLQAADNELVYLSFRDPDTGDLVMVTDEDQVTDAYVTDVEFGLDAATAEMFPQGRGGARIQTIVGTDATYTFTLTGDLEPGSVRSAVGAATAPDPRDREVYWAYQDTNGLRAWGSGRLAFNGNPSTDPRGIKGYPFQVLIADFEVALPDVDAG